MCPNGLGYSADGMVVIAAAWGPSHDGHWITWWADTPEYIEWTGDTGAEADKLLRWMGMLHYITGAHMTLVDASPEEIAANRSPLNVAVDPHPLIPHDPGTLHGCISATAGGWWWLALRRTDGSDPQVRPITLARDLIRAIQTANRPAVRVLVDEIKTLPDEDAMVMCWYLAATLGYRIGQIEAGTHDPDITT